MNRSADDIWRRLLNGIEVELQTQVNTLTAWADILDGILDELHEGEGLLVMHEDQPPITADEILDDIRDAIKRFGHLEDQLRDEFYKTYGDQNSNEV